MSSADELTHPFFDSVKVGLVRRNLLTMPGWINKTRSQFYMRVRVERCGIRYGWVMGWPPEMGDAQGASEALDAIRPQVKVLAETIKAREEAR